MGSPAGSSGTGGGSTANVYVPKQQGTADFNFNNILQPLIDASTNGGAGTPGGWAYPQAQAAYQTYFTNYPAIDYGYQQATNAAQDYQNGGYLSALSNAKTLGGAGNTVLNTAFDPQSALFNRGQQQVADQANATNAMSGVGSTPYGSSVTAGALKNYDIDWQNQQLKRQLAGLEGAGTAFGRSNDLGLKAASGLDTLAAAPYNFSTNVGSNLETGLSDAVKIGNQQYTLPQQVIDDLESYLGLGQSASTISGNLGALGSSELASGIGGLGSLAGGIGSLSNSSLGSGIGGLFSGTSATGLGSDLTASSGIADVSGGGSALSSILPFSLGS